MSKLYELKKDVSMPGQYWRAGTKKTDKEWKKIFPEMRIEWEREWFIDLSIKEERGEIDALDTIVEKVFSAKGLHSLSYKDAAREVAITWENYLKTNKLLTPISM